MASYIVRVELDAATPDDYALLHAAMERRNYTRTIRGEDGLTYRLPAATYVMANSIITITEACDAAVRSAQETHKFHSLIVTDWVSGRFLGLRRI
jgi:hypothetical protein